MDPFHQVDAINASFEQLFDASDRREWIRGRLWHNGPHAQCCKKCLQAGYTMAMVRANRLDMLGEYPELIAVYEELVKDGMIVPTANHGQASATRYIPGCPSSQYRLGLGLRRASNILFVVGSALLVVGLVKLLLQ